MGFYKDLMGYEWDIPSGKRLHNYGKIHHFSWVNPLFESPFSIAMLNYQRVSTNTLDIDGYWIP